MQSSVTRREVLKLAAPILRQELRWTPMELTRL